MQQEIEKEAKGKFQEEVISSAEIVQGWQVEDS